MKKKKRRPRGRPSKLDSVAAEKIIEAVRAGAYRKVAAVFAGISERTLREWLVLGQSNPQSAHGVFRRRLREAAATAEITVSKVAYEAAARDPFYAMRYLSVRWRKRWDPAHKVELTGKDGKDLIPQSDPTTLLEKLRKMEALGKPPEKDKKP